MTVLVTGGAGFIGSNFVLDWFAGSGEPIVNLDSLTYAGNLGNLASLERNPSHVFVHGDIGDAILVDSLLATHHPRAVINFAAESHVDRSIHGPEDFVQTNVVGTFRLLESVRGYFAGLPEADRAVFRFLHVSTDEVFGSLSETAPPFREDNQYQPNSPYAASKASADHLVRAYRHTYGLPTLTTNCSNNYGPFQFPEKLIPLVITRALAGETLPVYGDGGNVRDWLFVGDHCSAIRRVLERGVVGETYNVGGRAERRNIDVVQGICAILDRRSPKPSGGRYADQIRFVQDRPGHDRRYAIDSEKISRELGWTPTKTFETGLDDTVNWYLGHTDWTQRVVSGAYRDWVKKQYTG